MSASIGREMADLHRKVADLMHERENLRESHAKLHAEVTLLGAKLADAEAEVERQRKVIAKLDTEVWSFTEVCDQRDDALARAAKAEARIRDLEVKMAVKEAT